jgi:hypothetical protein
MVKKAQAEIIVLVGIVLLALVVIYYAVSGGFTSSNVPPGIAEQQKAVQESFLSMAREGADRTLEVMEAHGGYPTEELLGGTGYTIPDYTIFMGEGVPYWAACGNNLAPSRADIKKWFELSMENYIKNNMDGIKAKYRNVTFDLDKLSVSASIARNTNKIDVTVNLPTKVSGYSIQNPSMYPYRVSIASKLGEIYDFASNFSKAQSSKRFFEVFTTASIYMSKSLDDGYPKLPTGGYILGCGRTVYRTPEQISFYLREIVEYILSQTIWWQNMPVDPDKPKVYAINREIIGTEYKDLDISMALADGFSFETRQPVVLTNTKPAYTSLFWRATKCLSTYRQGYSVSYPAIIRVNDPLSGHDFNFAVKVFVDYKETDETVDIDGASSNVVKMVPGNCGDIQAGGAVCTGLPCSARITVTDGEGNPIKGAVASYGGCGLGTSDASGVIQGQIKCGEHELNIYRNSSYDYFSENVSSSAINATYALHKIPEMTAHFRKVTIFKQYQDAYGSMVEYKPCPADHPGSRVVKCVVENAADFTEVEMLSGSKGYILTNLDQENMDLGCIENQQCKDCLGTGDQSSCMACSSLCISGFSENVKVEYIPSGFYTLNATMTNMGAMKQTGGFLSNYGIPSSANHIYFNVPSAGTPDYSLSESTKSCLAQELAECQMSAASETAPLSTYFSDCSCSGLKALVSQFSGTCLNADDLNSAYCMCPSGGSYPADCGKTCSADPYDPLACSDCCAPLDTIKNLLLSKCKVKVVCR